jgi:ribulose-phosphate 3-epimerase
VCLDRSAGVVYAAAMREGLIIAPSILSADFGKLREEIAEVEAAGADWIHVDVMDGRFVPNITLGPVVVKAVRAATQLPVDVHLMIEEPERYVGAFAEAGADWISVHLEASRHLQRTLAEIRRLGKRAGVVLNPHTPEDALRYVMDDVDLVLVMTVNPGFGGQSYLKSVTPKIAALRERIRESGRDIVLEVDGGVAPDTIEEVVAAGADAVVAGAAVFGARDRKAALHALRTRADAARVGR